MYLGAVDHKPILGFVLFIYKSFQPYLGLGVFLFLMVGLPSSG